MEIWRYLNHIIIIIEYSKSDLHKITVNSVYIQSRSIRFDFGSPRKTKEKKNWFWRTFLSGNVSKQNSLVLISIYLFGYFHWWMIWSGLCSVGVTKTKSTILCSIIFQDEQYWTVHWIESLSSFWIHSNSFEHWTGFEFKIEYKFIHQPSNHHVSLAAWMYKRRPKCVFTE